MLTAAEVAVLCGFLAVAASVLTVVVTQQGLPRPSALIKMSYSEPMAELAREADPSFVFVQPDAHYDGVYYYTMARDPLLLGEEHTRIDLGPYRYGHPMYGWSAAILSLGNAKYVPHALLLLSFTGIGVAAWAMSSLAVMFGRTAWGGLLVPASPGLLYASTISTTECFGAGLLGLTLLCWLRGRVGIAAVLMVCLCLTKEYFIFVPAGLGLWEVVQHWRLRTLRIDMAKVGALAAGPAALAAWLFYVQLQYGEWPASPGEGNVGIPIAGWLDTFRMAYAMAGGSFDQSQIGVTTPPILMAMAVVFCIAFAKALQMKGPLDGVVLGMMAFASTWGWRVLLYPHEIVRSPSIVLLVAVGSLFVGAIRVPAVRENEADAAAAAGVATGT